jgi:hypothetical protein
VRHPMPARIDQGILPHNTIPHAWGARSCGSGRSRCLRRSERRAAFPRTGCDRGPPWSRAPGS